MLTIERNPRIVGAGVPLLIELPIWAGSGSGGSGGAADIGIALLTSLMGTPGGNGGTLAGSIDTTGASLLVMHVAFTDFVGAVVVTIADSKSNVWTPGTLVARGANLRTRIWYAKAALVGTNHTFACSGSFTNPVVSVLAYKNAHADPFVTESSGGGTTSPLTVAPVVPTVNGSLIVTGWAGEAVLSDPVVSAPFTRRHFANSAASNWAGGVGDLVQGLKASISPTWAWTGGGTAADDAGVINAVFRPA